MADSNQDLRKQGQPELETETPLIESWCKPQKETIKIRHTWTPLDGYSYSYLAGLHTQSTFSQKFRHNDKVLVLNFALKLESPRVTKNYGYCHYETHFYLSSEEHLKVKAHIYRQGENGEKVDMFRGMISFDQNQKVFRFATLPDTSDYGTIYCELELQSLLLEVDVSTKSSSQPNSLVQNLSNVFDLNDDLPFSDVVVECGEESYSCHKFLLAARSSVFAAMFAQPLKESLENKVDISDAEDPVVKQFLRFLYTDYVKNSFEDASSLLPLADKYDVLKLKSECEHIICDNMEISNALDAIYLGHIHNAPYLYSFSVGFIVENLKHLISTEKFKEIMTMEPKILMDVLKKKHQDEDN